MFFSRYNLNVNNFKIFLSSFGENRFLFKKNTVSNLFNINFNLSETNIDLNLYNVDENYWVFFNELTTQENENIETEFEGVRYNSDLNLINYYKKLFLLIIGANSTKISSRGAVVYVYNVVKSFLSKYLSILLFNFKWILLSLIITLVYSLISLFYIQVEITKQIAVWFILFILFYALMSTFNSFLNKYKYGKFTSAIQRFWKRTGIVFWLIEGFLFLLFFYYFLNSSQEPLYMFDYSNLNQELLIQFKTSAKNMILISVAIYFSFILILNNNFLNYYQNIVILSIISLIVFYMLFVETYQFVYIISIFAEKNWLFNESSQIWVLEFEQNNLRVKQQYFILCLIAKYWHFIFIFISWFFFLIKCLEVNKINYNLLGYNTQNLIILYVLNLMCLIQWFKYLFKKFLEIVYYWFHTQYDEKFLSSLVSEIITILKSLISFDVFDVVLNNVRITSNVIFCSNSIFLWKYN